MKAFLRQLKPALLLLCVFTAICGVAYPLAMTGVAQVGFAHQANGSLVRVDGVVVGSELLGQPFVATKYFHSRPSAAGDGYDAGASSGSNLGPTNQVLLDAVAERVAAYRAENNLSPELLVPVDAVTSSGSGLDPHISVRNAQLQAPRVAQERHLDVTVINELIKQTTDDRALLVLGDPGVNVMKLNLALDQLSNL